MRQIRTMRERRIKRLIDRLGRKLDGLSLRSRRLSSLRLGIFSLSLLLVWVMGFIKSNLLQIGVPGIGFFLFGFVVFLHCRVQAKIKDYRTWLKIKQGQYAQMRLAWEHLPSENPESPEPRDPMDVDLNLTGPGSLHRLINFAVSQEGGHRLRDWLLVPQPDFKRLRQRQENIKELLLDQRFRERFLLTFFRSSERRLCGSKLIRWLEQGTITADLYRYLILSAMLCIGGWTLFILASAGRLPAYWIVCLIIYFSLYLLKAPQIQKAMDDVQKLDDELAKLKPVLQFLETYHYRNLPMTRKVCHPFNAGPKRPSKQLKVVKFYTTAIGLRMNPVMAILLNGTMPWDLFFAYLIERRKHRLKEQIPEWMETFYDLEALISLANFAYVNPDYIFPNLAAEEGGDAVFSTTAMGHPLISPAKKVRNDFAFEKLGDIVLITGSNMTGKSTFLKTLGLNLRLAYAGGPVDAEMMSTSLFRVLTSIRISDSLAEDVSYFYAEVKRLKYILTALQESEDLPAFFLIDEIFKGTNNLERYLGSKPYIKAVSGGYGVGLITTHDVTLCQLEQDSPSIFNRHFGDTVIEGKFAFEYKLLSGPSTSTNALKILEKEGLPVE